MTDEKGKTKPSKKAKSDGNPKVDSFFNKDGLLIKTYAWAVTKPSGIIVLVHGLKSCIMSEYLRHNIEYDIKTKKVTLKDGDDFYIYKNSWIEELNKHNYSVYGMDLQGHGQSDGLKNLKYHINKFDDLVYDVIQYINRIHDIICLTHKKEYDNYSIHDNITNTQIPPFFLMGLSMGGNIVMRILEILGKSKDNSKKVNIKGCIVLAGMISLANSEKKTSFKYFYLPIGKFLATVLPTSRITPPIHAEMYPFVKEIFTLDKNILKKGITCKFGVELLNAVENLKIDSHYIPEDVHLLFFHAVNDSLCAYEGTIEFTKQLKNKNLEVVSLNDMDHVLTIEPGNEKILEKIIEWLSNILKYNDKDANEIHLNNKIEDKTQIVEQEN